jgi:hypothetical protein
VRGNTRQIREKKRRLEQSSARVEADDLAVSFTKLLPAIAGLASNRRIVMGAGKLRLAHDCKLPPF